MHCRSCGFLFFYIILILYNPINWQKKWLLYTPYWLWKKNTSPIVFLYQDSQKYQICLKFLDVSLKVVVKMHITPAIFHFGKKHICTRIGTLIPWGLERTQQDKNSGKCVFCLRLDESISYSSENKHHEKATPRLKFSWKGDYSKKDHSPGHLSSVRFPPKTILFVPERRLQKEEPEPRDIIMVSIPRGDGFYSKVTNHDRRTMP